MSAQALIQEALTRNNAVVRAFKKPDQSYIREWNKYKTYVTERRALGELSEGDKFLTRENVDLYFSRHVARLISLNPESARRIVPSLQYFADMEEHQNVAGRGFVVENPVVKQALECQRAEWIANEISTLTDPHADLPTNVITPEEHKKAILYAIGLPEWKDLTYSWLTCRVSFLRNCNVKTMVISRMRLEKDVGPKPRNASRTTPCAPCLAYILRRNEVVKDSNSRAKKRTRLVGGIRHADPFQCMIGLVAMNLFHTLQTDTSMSFFVQREGTPTWQNKRIMQKWGTGKAGYEAARQSYTKVTRACGINWCKVTHLRKAGMDEASKGGVEERAISSMSKHASGEKVSCYVTELNAKLLKYMAGFSDNEEYFLPRSELILPDWITKEQLTDLCFPASIRWRREQQSALGDASEAARNFLYELLPFLSTVIFQDGIYWIKKFPEHEVSRLLLNKMPPAYERWAESARVEVKLKQDTRGGTMVDTFNEAAQQTFSHVLNAIKDVLVLHEQVAREVSEIRAAQVNNNNNGGDNNNYDNEANNDDDDDPNTANNNNNVPPQNRARARISVNDALRNTPLAPAFPAQLPNSCIELLLQHELFRLNDFSLVAKKDWPSNIRLSYSRRMYLFRMIEEKAARSRQGGTAAEKREAAAKELDLLKGEKSMYQFLQQLKSHDTSTKKRKRT